MQRKNDYHKLVLWQKGKLFIKLIYKITESFPKVEVFGLQSQVRRAVVSFLLNIVEGHRRNNSQKELLRFLDMADSSLVEVEACLEMALELNFLSKEDYQLIDEKRRELAVMLIAFINKIKIRE